MSGSTGRRRLCWPLAGLLAGLCLAGGLCLPTGAAAQSKQARPNVGSTGPAPKLKAKSKTAPKKKIIADDPKKSRHFDLERLFADDELKKGMDLANARLKADPDDPELMVHAYRFRFAWGERYGRTTKGFDKERWYVEMLELCDRGLALAPDHPRLLWGKALALARLGTTRGVLASIRTAKQIEGLWQRVIDSGYRYSSLNGMEVLPCDAMVALGIFYRIVPDWWLVQLLAGTRGDIDKSIAYLRRADQCRPDGIGTLKELGAALLCKADRDDDEGAQKEAEVVLRRAMRLKGDHSVLVIDRRHAKFLLEHPNKACGYSRDGQQELDEDLLPPR